MLEEEHHQILKSRRKETQTSKLQTQPQSSIIVHTTKMYCREITFLNIISNQPSVVIQSDKYIMTSCYCTEQIIAKLRQLKANKQLINNDSG